jgi:spermidine/putrescine transport system ATP-binding protein
MTMADEIAVMNEGRIEQRGSAHELYETPQTAFVANFLGVSNLIDGTLRRREGGVAEFETHDGAALRVPVGRIPDANGGALCAGVRPEKIDLLPADGTTAPRAGDNVLRGRVSVAAYLGVAIQYVIAAAGGEELTVMAQNKDGTGTSTFGPGTEVQLAWSPDHTFIVSKESPHAQ